MSGWTLEVDWLGKTWSWDHVAAELTESMDLFTDTPSVRSASFDVVFAGVSVSARYSQGHRLEGATARLLLDGERHLVGTVDAPIWRPAGDEPSTSVSFSIREAPWDDSGVFPPRADFLTTVPDYEATQALYDEINDALPNWAQGRISAATWDTTVLSQGALGGVYPYVFGSAGQIGSGTTLFVDRVPASLAPIVDVTTNDEVCLLAGHQCPDATNILLLGDEGDSLSTGTSFAIAEQDDLSGRRVTVVPDLNGDPTFLGSPANPDRRLYVIWHEGSTPGDVIRVLETVLAHSTIRVDWPRLRGLRDWGQRYQLAGVIDEEVTPWEWVRDNVLPLLSASVVLGQDGLYLAPWEPDGAPVAYLVEGPDCAIDPEVRVANTPICNEYRLSYAYNAYTDDHARTAVADPKNSAYAAISRQEYGPQVLQDETEIVYAPRVAEMIALEKVRDHGFRDRLFTAHLNRAKWGHIRPGDKVVLASATLSLDDAECVVLARTLDGGPVVHCELATRTDPLRQPWSA